MICSELNMRSPTAWFLGATVIKPLFSCHSTNFKVKEWQQDYNASSFQTLISIKIYCVMNCSSLFHLAAPLSGMICQICPCRDSIRHLYFSLLCLFKKFFHPTLKNVTNHKTCIEEVKESLFPPHINCSVTTLLTPQNLLKCYLLNRQMVRSYLMAWGQLNSLELMVKKRDCSWNGFCKLLHLSHSTKFCWSLIKWWIAKTSPTH